MAFSGHAREWGPGDPSLTAPPRRGFLSHLYHPAHGLNIREQGQAGCVALGTGCPSCLRNHSSYWALYKFLLNFPGAHGQREEF